MKLSSEEQAQYGVLVADLIIIILGKQLNITHDCMLEIAGSHVVKVVIIIIMILCIIHSCAT